MSPFLYIHCKLAYYNGTNIKAEEFGIETQEGKTMALWDIILIVVLVMSATMIGFGLLFSRHSPKKINFVLGYRSPMSMKNAETWEFGNVRSGKILWRTGCVLLVGSLITLFAIMSSDVSVIRIAGIAIIIVHAVLIFASVILTEIALRKNFDREGNRR